MKIRSLITASVLILASIPSLVRADDESVGCAQRGYAYCELSNVGENCTVGTCNASLSDGDCTVEAVFNGDNSAVSSCRVCSTAAVNSAGCQALGGSLRSPS